MNINTKRIEYEDEVLGMWLTGEHLEDVKHFCEDNFIRADLFRMINSIVQDAKKKNEEAEIDIFNIAKELKYKRTDLTKLIDATSNTFYKTAIKRQMDENIVCKIKSLDTTKNIEELLQDFNEAISFDSCIKSDSNFKEQFLEEMEHRKNEKRIRYGIPTLDLLTGGIHRKELTVVAARPGCGKTAFGMQTSYKAQNWNEKVLFFPLEMSTEQMLERLIQHENYANSNNLKEGRLAEADAEEIAIFLDTIEKRNKLLFYEGIRDIYDIEALIKKEKPYLVVIDQLTQMNAKGENFRSEYEHHSFMTKKLKEISLSTNTAIMLLHQINRPGENNAELSNLKGSGSLEEDADNVIFLSRIKKDKYTGSISFDDNECITACEIKKQRNGATGSFVLAFRPEKFKFYEKTNI